MVELVDTRDLKSLDGKMSCRFDSGSRHTALHIRGAFLFVRIYPALAGCCIFGGAVRSVGCLRFIRAEGNALMPQRRRFCILAGNTVISEQAFGFSCR